MRKIEFCHLRRRCYLLAKICSQRLWAKCLRVAVVVSALTNFDISVFAVRCHVSEPILLHFRQKKTNEWNDFTRFNILRLWHLDYSFWQSIEPRVAVSMRNLIFLNRRRSLFSWGSRKLVSFENHRIAQHQHLKRALRYLSSDETDSSNKNNSNNFLEILCKARPQFLVFLVKRLLLGKFLWGQKDFPLCDTRKLIFPSSRCDPTTMKIEIASARQHHELG